MSPEDFISKNRSPDQVGFRRLDFNTKQEFLENRDYVGLVAFYSEVLALAHPEKYLSKVTSISCSGYLEELRLDLEKAAALADRNRAKAIYYEWERSSGSSNFFICQSYSSTNSDWACRDVGTVDGPSIEFSMTPEFEETLLSPEQAIREGIWGVESILSAAGSETDDIDPSCDFEFSAFDEQIIALYFDAQFLSGLGQQQATLGQPSLIFGAAEHDHDIHIFR